MTDETKGKLDQILDHYIMVCLFLALPVLTLAGVGSVVVVGLLGILLCVVGLAQGAVKVDLWILSFFIIYNLFSVVSSYITYGNIVEGYASTQMIYPVLYLLMACLDDSEQLWLRRLCAVWAGSVAVLGIVQYGSWAMAGGDGRMAGILGNPNAMGIFLVLGWFILLQVTAEGKKSPLDMLEPVLLTALAMTVSMGSFLSLAAGILVLIVRKKQDSSWQKTFWYGCCILAKASLAVGTGILIYLGADRTDAPWSCWVLFGYLLVLTACWEKFQRFLEEKKKISAVISAMGLLVAATAVAVRPNAVATFQERLDMMANGLHYFMVNPFLGVGPYQWRIWNLYDRDPYFNTNHIHNAFIHVGAEFGLVALAMLLCITIRCFIKKKTAAQLAGCVAFLVHNLIDTGFFYLVMITMAMVMAGEPHQKGSVLGAAAVKLLFGAFALLFGYNLYWYLKVGVGG